MTHLVVGDGNRITLIVCRLIVVMVEVWEGGPKQDQDEVR